MDKEKRVQERIEQIKKDAAKGGYLLNPDSEVVKGLVEGLVENDERYGMESCPCRLYKGEKEDNLDIVCPCIYRDEDLAEYGACYCALYVAGEKDTKAVKQVPERRPSLEKRKDNKEKKKSGFNGSSLAYPVFRCRVCGYLCAANNPPRVCPVCKAANERFERFL